MSVNKVILKGRLGDNPTLNSGKVRFPLATDEGYKDKEGNKVEKTAWHNVVAFGKLGEIFEKYLNKGDEVLIIGKLDYYKNDEGKYFTSIIANEFDFVSKGNNNQEGKNGAVLPQTPPELDDDLPY